MTDRQSTDCCRREASSIRQTQFRRESTKVTNRPIRRIIWHCSATPEGRDVSSDEIRRWHTDPRPAGRGWRAIGYHYVIRLDGTIEPGREEHEVGAHVIGHNTDSIGICYVGGTDSRGRAKDTRTPAQKTSLYKLTGELLRRYPGASVSGHNEYAAKGCPSFDARSDWAAHASRLPMHRGEAMADEPTGDLQRAKELIAEALAIIERSGA
jgi:N-acetylmuramoyl-L-alanine amidase